mmetsp:Transcript_43709/g.95592  ORF Transcript_43709/g.95592 Transcript_43709/m.95592 type:complete len:329 (-) Transcript_43709:28-1014(-)
MYVGLLWTQMHLFGQTAQTSPYVRKFPCMCKNRHVRSEGTCEDGHVRGRLARVEALLAVNAVLLVERIATDRCLGLRFDRSLGLGVVAPRHQEEPRRAARVGPLKRLLHLVVAFDLKRLRLQPRLRRRQQLSLHLLQLLRHCLSKVVVVGQRELVAARALDADQRARLHVARANLHAQRDAATLPLEVLRARAHRVAMVHEHAHASHLHLSHGSVHKRHERRVVLRRLLRTLGDGHHHHLGRRNGRRQHEAGVVRVRHNERADEARAHAPRGCPHELLLVLVVLERHVKGLCKVLAEKVRGARLKGPAVLHQSLNRVGLFSAREALSR